MQAVALAAAACAYLTIMVLIDREWHKASDG
jgi:hypothetical protein